jgi:hypothetical protein
VQDVPFVGHIELVDPATCRVLTVLDDMPRTGDLYVVVDGPESLDVVDEDFDEPLPWTPLPKSMECGAGS